MKEQDIKVGDDFDSPSFGPCSVIDIYVSSRTGRTVFEVQDERGDKYLARPEDLV